MSANEERFIFSCFKLKALSIAVINPNTLSTWIVCSDLSFLGPTWKAQTPGIRIINLMCNGEKKENGSFYAEHLCDLDRSPESHRFLPKGGGL